MSTTVRKPVDWTAMAKTLSPLVPPHEPRQTRPKKPPADDSLLIDFGPAAKIIGISEAALRKRWARGQIPTWVVKKTGSRVQFVRAKLIIYAEGKK